MEPEHDVTRLLNQLTAGRREALDDVFAAVHSELRRIVHRQLALPLGAMDDTAPISRVMW